jgi:hypothetical protein
MSLIYRVVIGYFDAHASCAVRSITPIRPVEEDEVSCLQVACHEAFGIKVALSNHLTRDGVLCFEDARVHRDTYKAAAVAHSLFGMSVVDHADRCVIFPAENKPLPDREQFLSLYKSLYLGVDEPQRQQVAEEHLRWMHEEREFERGVRERVGRFTAAWRNRVKRSWVTPTVLSLARMVSDKRQFDVLPVLADALEEAGCTDQAILDHLRGPGRHIHNCWAVDLVLAEQ